MFNRLSELDLVEKLRWSPAVAILGARQVGKTTLAKNLLQTHAGAVYLDLERPQDRERLGDGELFFQNHAQELVILDEVQNAPELFSLLRGEIDRLRRPGRFVLLGSASFELLQQSQSLAGRLAIVDMQPLVYDEVKAQADNLQTLQKLWVMGGFPESYQAPTSHASWAWRDAFIRHQLHTDLPALGLRADPEAIRRFWRMLANNQGQIFNALAFANALDVSAPTVTRWLDFLTGALLVRRLEPYFINLNKRLVKSPKVYVRDSGLLHNLLGLPSVSDLQGHTIAGASWEGFVIDQIQAHLPPGATMNFYRTAAGAELDVVVEMGNKKLGFEIKFSSNPKPAKGFWQSLEDIKPDQSYIVAPVATGWAVRDNVHVLPVGEIARVFV